MDRIGKYEILRELGRGATSTVYLALDTFNNQQVALKLFDLQRLNDTSISKAYRKLLLTEASLAGKLSHPHIVKVLDAVMEDELSYIVMEYVDGKTLDRNAEVDNLLPLSTVAEIIYKCCKALEYAQFQGVTHRDIKPENILLILAQPCCSINKLRRLARSVRLLTCRPSKSRIYHSHIKLIFILWVW